MHVYEGCVDNEGDTFESGWQVARVGGADADIALFFGLLLSRAASGAEENTDRDKLLEKAHTPILKEQWRK